MIGHNEGDGVKLGHAEIITHISLKKSLALLWAMSLVGCATTNELAETTYSPNDPNVACKPKYTQVYQPPLKLGGAGRVIQVPSGQTCEPIAGKEGKADEAAYTRQAKFTSLPAGVCRYHVEQRSVVRQSLSSFNFPKLSLV